jgi:hypothetical protein
VTARRRRQTIALVVTACCVELMYWVLVTAGHVTERPHFYVGYLDAMAEGFRQWHLHLSIEPSPALLKAANPAGYENHLLWLWDASLHGGHYYLYWGPVPALLLAIAKTILRVNTLIYDEMMVFALASLQLAAGTWTVGRAARSFFDDPPLPLQIAAVLVIGFANPIPYNLGRGAVYEAAIVGGQAFLMLGIACAAESFARTTSRRRWVVATGSAWALALGCRVSLAPAIALMMAVTAWAQAGPAEGTGGRLRRLVRAGAPGAIPLAVGLFLLLLYNRLRFDEWLEFGRRYQLTWIAAPTNARFFLPNLYSYLLRATEVSCRFPYAFAIPDMGPRAFPSWYHLPDGYFIYEQVAGLLVACPWSWLAPAALVAAVRQRRAAGWTPAVWAIAVAAIAAVVAILPGMSLASATNRYLGDAVGGVTLLGTFGLFALQRDLQGRPSWRRAVTAAGLTVALLSVWAGLALGFLGQYAHFPNNNPDLANKLVQKLSLCGGPPVPQPK